MAERPARLLMRWPELEIVAHEAWAQGFRPACAQHEIEQADGTFQLQRLAKLKQELTVKRWRRQRWAGTRSPGQAAKTPSCAHLLRKKGENRWKSLRFAIKELRSLMACPRKASAPVHTTPPVA